MGFASVLLTIFTVVQLNCENLFDCAHDSLKDDTEFLPSSARHYTMRRYWDKLSKISKEISWCGCNDKDFHLPDIITLCEVENDSVLTYLTRRSSLRTARYGYVATSSPDLRGIDVAVLYNPSTFLPLSHSSISVTPLEGMRPTRDILHVEGITQHGDTLHVFAVHMPSKYGGDALTRPFRAHVAQRLCAAVDSIRDISPDADIIISGDFNDDASSTAVRMIESAGFTNISAGAEGSHGARATYKYKGLWQSIDHILVSSRLLSHLKYCEIKDAPFLLEKDNVYGGCKPKRFWNGYRYNKGFSDHLPLKAEFDF